MRIAFCADIHIGAPNTNLSELMQCFEQMITSSDMVVIGGDLLDAKYQTSSENVTLLLDLMDYITPMVASQRKILRLIYGTQSHDGYPQLQILNPYTKRMNFRIIHHVEEEIINRVSFLYMPEEIISDKHEYYANTLYSGKTYDYIFGHGVIAEGMGMVKENKIKKVRSVPVFKTEELRSACKQYCLFGHYHRHWVSGNVGYVGSITRFRHGEPEEKGWYQVDGNHIQFIENQWCPKYTEIKVVCTDYNIDDFQTFITTNCDEFRLNGNERDRIKFVFFIDRHLPESDIYIDIIRKLCKGEGISYNIKDMNESVLQDESISDKYEYILDPNIPIKDKINRYNEMEFDGTLDDAILDQYLSKVKVN